MHALSGCDTISAFHGIGKKTAGLFGAIYLISQPFFSRIAHAPGQMYPGDLNEIERYVVFLYCRGQGYYPDYIVRHFI